MKRVAVVGMGFMGRTHYGVWRKLRGAKVVAVCDSNLARLTAGGKGNLGSTDAALDLKGVDVFSDFDEMLARGGVDIVDITLPTFLHPVMAKKAMSAGCDVLCEKPMALSAKICDEMLRAAKTHRRHLMIGQCTRFSDIHVYMKKLIDTGKYGISKTGDNPVQHPLAREGHFLIYPEFASLISEKVVFTQWRRGVGAYRPHNNLGIHLRMGSPLPSSRGFRRGCRAVA